MPENLQKNEVVVILSYLFVRGFLVLSLSFIIGAAFWALLTELNKEDPNAALTALLGMVIGFIGSSLIALANAIAMSVLDYLKDRLGTRGKAEE